MYKKINKLFPISILLFFAVELFLTKNGQFQIGIIVYLIYSFILYSIDKRYIISFFVFNLPLLPLVSTDYKLFGIAGPQEIIYGFSMMTLFQLSLGNRTKLNEFQKIAIKFVYFLLFFNVYVITKDILVGLDSEGDRGLFYIFKNFIRFFLYYYSLVLLIKVIYQKEVYNFIIIGMKLSLITLVLSMIFSKFLVYMGVGIGHRVDEEILADKGTRFVGLYGGGGDENSAGIFLAGVFGFFIALYEKTGNIKSYVVYLGFAVFGVLLTGSRTAFIALALIILIFLITNKSNVSRFAILIAIVFFYFTFSKQVELVTERFLDDSAFAAVDPNQKGRVGKWIIYIDWILNNPETLIYGNQSKIDYNRAPHNYFIIVLYQTGIIPLIVLGILFISLLKKIRIYMNAGILKSIYYIIPFPLILLTVNSFGSSIYLWIYLPMGAVFFNAIKNQSK